MTGLTNTHHLGKPLPKGDSDAKAALQGDWTRVGKGLPQGHKAKLIKDHGLQSSALPSQTACCSPSWGWRAKGVLSLIAR